MKDFFKRKEMAILIILVGLGFIITLVNPTFLTVSNIVTMIKNNLVVGIMAMGMALVMITGGIDLSVGASLSAICYIVAYFLVNISDNLFLAFLVAITSGFAIGFVNYLIIAKLNVPAMVATLGTMSILSGGLLYITSGNRINIMPQSLVDFSKISLIDINAQGRVTGIPVQIVFFIGISLMTWFILKHTRIGRGVYAVGGNIEFAKRAGFNCDRILMFVYSFLGVMVGVASFISISIYKQVDPSAYSGFEFAVVAVVVLGGVSISGGYGSVFGIVLGTLMMGTIKNGLVLAFIPTYWQEIILGIIILLAIVVNALQEARKRRNVVKVDV